MVSFIFLRVNMVGEWGVCQFPGFICTYIIGLETANNAAKTQLTEKVATSRIYPK